MEKIDFILFKALGYMPKWDYFTLRPTFTMIVNGDQVRFDSKGKPQLNTTWMIPIGDKEETDRILEQLSNYVKSKEKDLEEIEKLLSLSYEEKKKIILDNFEKLVQMMDEKGEEKND